MKGAYDKINNYKLVKFSLFVSIGVDSEEVPEDIVQLSLSIFLKNFNNESSQILFGQVSL